MINYKRTKFTCYFTYIAMSAIFALPPLLFVTFHDMYGISYTMVGTLILINFITQLSIDLIFSFFSEKFNLKIVVILMPLITFLGWLSYSLIPLAFPNIAYLGLAIGTVIFSVSAGLSEALISPIVAAIPSDNPSKDMSLLHSMYAYGVVSVILISTILLYFFGRENWMFVGLFWSIFPLIDCILYATSPIPNVKLTKDISVKNRTKNNLIIILCVLCIFFGSASENIMTNWIATYVEKSIHIEKVWGDIFGMGLFALFLGITRSLYAKFGKNIFRFLVIGMAGSLVCYLIVGLSNIAILSLITCVILGIFVSMLWPGTLILLEENSTDIGVSTYALMAAGGDFGASMAPQLMGIIVDAVALSGMAINSGIGPEEFGLKTGMLISVIFPLCGLIVLLIIKKKVIEKKHKEIEN